MSRNEAYELAKLRGYTGAVTSLNRDVKLGDMKQFGIGLISAVDREYGPAARNYLDEWG